MILITYSFLTFFYLSIIIRINCSSTSSILLNRLRKHKTIAFQPTLSSPIEINLKTNSKFHLTCSFLSNFDRIDIFWLHNGTLIESFISKNIVQEEEDDNVENSFLSVSIVSTINIKKIHFDINGFYQCIGVHQEIYAQQTFNVHIDTIEPNSPAVTNLSTDALITVHTSQALFEPREYISLMCRTGNKRKDQCKTQWFDPNNEPLNLLGDKTDLVIKNATFDNHMGLYTCRICCYNQCEKLTSFLYPAAGEDK